MDIPKVRKKTTNPRQSKEAAGWSVATEAALGHLATMGPGFFIYGLIVICTFIALSFGAGIVAAVTGLAFAMLFVYRQDRLYNKEFDKELEVLDVKNGKLAGEIIDANATDSEKLEMERLVADIGQANVR